MILSLYVSLQYERLSHIISNYLGKPVGQIQSLSRSTDLQTEGFTGQGMLGGPFVDLDFGNSSNSFMQYSLNGIEEMEKSVMIETAVSAMGELLRLLRVNEPVWVKSSADGRYILHRDSYNKLFPKLNHFTNSTARIESSKDSGVVAMSAIHLVDMFLDSVHPLSHALNLILSTILYTPSFPFCLSMSPIQDVLYESPL